MLFFAVAYGGWVSHPSSFAAKPNYGVFDGKKWNEPIDFNWNYVSPEGYVTNLSYKFTQSTPIVMMDDDDNILELNCDDNGWDGNYYVVVSFIIFSHSLG